jgi:collagenase-like PrtC family protease
MKISVGPILYYWPRQKVQDFYTEMVKTPAEIIYLGETVCAKRRELRNSDWLELARQLGDSGKQIVISTLALIESRADIKALQKLCAQSHCLVEANDMAAVQILVENNLPFVAGASINIYNAHSLNILYKKGMQRWVMPVELSRESLADILQDAGRMGFADSIETEVFSYGKLPLAYSARCFTARAKNLAKDNCKLSCIEFPDGLAVHSQALHSQALQNSTNAPQLFTINGIQTQSGKSYNLLDQSQLMQRIGVDIMRISPQSENTAAVINRAATFETKHPALQLVDQEQCNGYWYGIPGMETAGLETAK